MKTIIRNATIITMDTKNMMHANASIAIIGNRIAAIGTGDDLDGASATGEWDVVDGSGKMVMPGLANLHTHFSMALARGMFEDFSPPNRPPFTGGFAPFPQPELCSSQNTTMCKLAAIEAIRSGTTAVLEDGFNISSYASAVARSGLRMVLAERAWDNSCVDIGSVTPFKRDEMLEQNGLERIGALHAAWNGAEDGRIRVGIAAWAPDACSPELFGKLLRLQDRLSCLCTIHLNQFWGEVEAVKAVRGKLPTQYLHEVGFLRPGLIAAHCRCMACCEEVLLGRAGVTAVFASAIAARRGLSPRIAELEARGCSIAMGSDNMSEDMVEVVRTGLFMERIRRGDGRNPAPEEVLRWATVNGYRALGIDDGGCLAQGNLADLIIVNLKQAHLVPSTRPLSTFIHQGQGSDIESVMVDGRWVMRNHRILTMDEDAIVAEADEIGRRAWSDLFGAGRKHQPPIGFMPLPN